MTTTANAFHNHAPDSKALRIHLKAQAQANKKKKIDPNLKRDLKHGWLLPYVAQADSLLWGRWNYWARCQAMPAQAYNRLRMEPALALMEGRPVNPLPKFVVEETLPQEPIPPISWEYSDSVIKMLDDTLDAIPNCQRPALHPNG